MRGCLRSPEQHRIHRGVQPRHGLRSRCPPYRFGLLGDGRRFRSRCFHVLRDGSAQEIRRPLYRTPRTWTHSRLLNFGGNTSTIYPFRTPGGGQLFGRTPINIFEPRQKNRAFANGPVLAKAGDRHRYVSITQEEYYEIRAAVEDGTYDYAIEDDVFDVAGYQDWLRQLEATGPIGLTGAKA